MTNSLAPVLVNELVEAVRSNPRVLPVGACTKPRLSATDAVPISTAGLCGLVEYDPAEFTFTALAGTPIKQLVAALAERGQYLPFDPMLAEAGSTLGGTVAAGLSGPGRFRFGGVRDFILGARFVDGSARLLRLGSKVVKSAAGFDLPKFFVGSLGRFGVLAELTFKVFPQPASRLTLKLAAADMHAAAQIINEAGNSRWQPEALDLIPDDHAVYLRLAGPAPALEEMSSEILRRWRGEVLGDAETFWSGVREFRWMHPQGSLFKIIITPDRLRDLEQVLRGLQDARSHISGGGNVAYVSLPSAIQAVALDEAIERLGLSGMAMRGESKLWLGHRSQPAIIAAVKQALDPANRFPGLED